MRTRCPHIYGNPHQLLGVMDDKSPPKSWVSRMGSWGRQTVFKMVKLQTTRSFYICSKPTRSKKFPSQRLALLRRCQVVTVEAFGVPPIECHSPQPMRKLDYVWEGRRPASSWHSLFFWVSALRKQVN